MANIEQYKVKQFIEAIPGTGGIVTIIARRVGCAWNTAKKYITQYPTVGRAYLDECERALDLAESVIFRAIEEGDVQTAKWYLMTRGKSRGYTGRTELSGPEGGPVVVVSWDETGAGV